MSINFGKNTFRTRQAPSPTGYLHLGTARQILFTKIFAKTQNGEWYLRLEDTDQNRLQVDSPKKLLKALEKLNLLPQEGINITNYNDNQKVDLYDIYQNGKFAPYIQSQRLSIYYKHAQNLIDQKLAYWSYLTDTEKQELIQLKKINQKPIDYYKICLEKYGEQKIYAQIENALKDSQKPVLRYKLQRNLILDCHDELLGKVTFDLNLEEDFVILKSDGFPSYHLAHLVDDFLMQTTLVIRAQEWFASLPKHIIMFKDYWGKKDTQKDYGYSMESKNGKNVPFYIHLPVILNEVGNKKMSKRDGGNVNIQDYLDKGFLPEAIINYLAFLGWNPGTEKELYLGKEDFSF
jgi:nondiscriminating glutamyl-tRNA synthetase